MFVEQIKKVYDEAISLKAAAKKLHMSEPRLRLIVKKRGWPKKPRAKPLGNRTRYRSMYDAIESGY